MLPSQIIPPQTTVFTTQPINCNEADKVLFATCGANLGAAETITFSVVTSANGTTPVYDASGAQVQLKQTLLSIELEGGFHYVAVKTATIGAVGLDAHFKARSGVQ